MNTLCARKQGVWLLFTSLNIPFFPFPTISFYSQGSKKSNSPSCQADVYAIFYLAYLWISEAQVYCIWSSVLILMDREPSVIHECLTPFKPLTKILLGSRCVDKGWLCITVLAVSSGVYLSTKITIAWQKTATTSHWQYVFDILVQHFSPHSLFLLKKRDGHKVM